MNGYSIASYGNNWYEAWQGAVYSARWAVEQPSFAKRFEEVNNAKQQAIDDAVRFAIFSGDHAVFADDQEDMTFIWE